MRSPADFRGEPVGVVLCRAPEFAEVWPEVETKGDLERANFD
ncbi:MAG: hypothetical protein AAF501_22095 [Pseudomonadota bacterium]